MKSPLVVISSNTSWYLYNFRKNTILALLKQGVRVLAVSPADEYVDRLLELGCGHRHITLDNGGTNPVKDFLSLLGFIRIYLKERPDAVLNFTPKNNIYGTLAARLCGAAVLNNVAGLGTIFIDHSLSSRLACLLYQLTQPLAQMVFFQNEEDRQFFLDRHVVPAERTALLPGSGADLNRFSPSPSPDDGTVRFILVARMLYDKGVGLYVEAARALRAECGSGVEFRLLGFLDVDNPSAVSSETMRQWVEEGAVNYLGTSDSVEEHIAAVDCVVLPSFYREGVPKSLLEAGAMAKPIITTDSIGCRRVVDDGVNGFLCRPGSIDSLIETMRRMIELSHAQRLGMGLKSREKIAAEFDEQVVIRRYLDSVQACIRSG